MAEAQAAAEAATEEATQAQATEGQTSEAEGKDNAVQQETPEQKAEREREHSLRRLQKSKDYWKEKALRYEGELSARREPVPTEKQSNAEDPEPQRGLYDSYEDYNRALTRWEVRQENKRLEEERERREAAQSAEAEKHERTKTWMGRVEKFMERHDDYLEVTAGYPLTQQMAFTMQELGDTGPAVSYYLGQHPDEAERISKLSPARQSAEIVKLEEKVTTPQRKPSRAPAPVKPVGGGNASADDDAPKDSDPPEVWAAKRNRQIARAQGRLR